MKEGSPKPKIDMLNGPIWNKLPLFALPVAATAVLEQLFNASDLAIVGNFTGAARTVSVAAVGANSFVISLLVNFFIGIALGVNVVIANAVGSRDTQTVRRTAHTAIVMALAGGLFILLVGELIAGPFLRLLQVPDEVYPAALLYLRIYLIGMPVILLYNFEAAIFRSVGDTRIPLEALAFSGVLNVLLNLFFVVVLGMTVDGVAVATVISNAVSSLLLFRQLVRSDKAIRIQPRLLRIDRAALTRILRIGLPAGIQSAVFSVSNLVIQTAVNSLGTLVMAASSAAFNIEIIAYYVMNSFTQACTTFVGQNFGAGQLSRCRRTFAICLAEDALASGTAALLILCSGRFLLTFFNNDPDVIELGFLRLKIVFMAYIFSVLYEMMSGYLRGFGISLATALLTTIGVCGVRILWVKCVFPLDPTFRTLLLAYPLSLSATAVLILIALLVCRPSHRFAKQAESQ